MAFVLHTHLPYCRLAGRWPHGEEWFHEAMLECYLPLIAAFRKLADEVPGTLGVTINVTPILAEQMADPLMLEHFSAYLDTHLERAESDIARFADGQRRTTARFHADRYRAMRALFDETLGRDVIAGLRDLESRGAIELATSAATHGYLPLLGDEHSVRFQIETGVESHLRHFGRAPRSFWLPECAYAPGVERLLDGAGIRVFFVETHLVTGGKARGKSGGGMLGPYPAQAKQEGVEFAPTSGTTFRSYSVGTSGVSVLARNERCGKQVWSAEHGYPGNGAYREFHKKDDVSGLHYWRVTGAGVDLGEKQEYDPEAALGAARSHAEHFRALVQGELREYSKAAAAPGIVMSSFDTELFGHWWFEGVPWLEDVIRGMRLDPAIMLTTTAAFIAENPAAQQIDMPEGSWGEGGDHRTWLNPATEWTWPEIRERQATAKRLATADSPATRQLLRELLLLQASDWQFLMTTGQAAEYAVERFRGHAERFDRLALAIDAGSPDAGSIAAELEALDNPFPILDGRALGKDAARPASV